MNPGALGFPVSCSKCFENRTKSGAYRARNGSARRCPFRLDEVDGAEAEVVVAVDEVETSLS